ncbi:hypothetical protein ACQPW3_28640 [Actinosynnema sp. CA-248983]
MNTELVSRTGLVPEQMIAPAPADVLEHAVERVLAAVRPSHLTDPLAGSLAAEQALREALRTVDGASADDAYARAVACAEAACEHLRYCELQEARLLLVAARGQLVRSHSGRA